MPAELRLGNFAVAWLEAQLFLFDRESETAALGDFLLLGVRYKYTQLGTCSSEFNKCHMTHWKVEAQNLQDVDLI